MAAQGKSLPYDEWPADIREGFCKAFQSKEGSHLARLRQMMGRWLLKAEQDGMPPELVTPHLMARRSEGLNPASRSVMKQSLFEVFGVPMTFVPVEKQTQLNDRERLGGTIKRNLHRFPEDWRHRVAPMLHICPDRLADGAVVDLRAPSSIESMVLLGAQYFDFCLSEDLPADLARVPFRAWVAHRRELFVTGDFSIHTMVLEAGRLLALGRDVFPERDWSWLESFRDKMKKSARHHPTRANQRFVAIEELRIAAQQGMEVARKSHEKAAGYRAKLQAHTLARTMLSILILINSPIRISSLTGLDLERHLDPGLSRLYLAPFETKDRNRDERVIPADVRAALTTYIELHRPLVAPTDETRLFVGWGGAPCTAGHMSEKIGDLTEALFGSRVTAHMIRNVIAAFIVSESPAEKGLASEILNHRGSASTETYSANASRIVASRQLGAAADAQNERLGLVKPSVQQKRKCIRGSASRRSGR